MSEVQRRVELTNTVQLILMIRDMVAKKYQLSPKDYEQYLTGHLQGVKNLKHLLNLVEQKITSDTDLGIDSPQTWIIRNTFDLGGLKIKTQGLYIHFHIAPGITIEQFGQLKDYFNSSRQKDPNAVLSVLHVGLDPKVTDSDVSALGNIIQINMHRYLTSVDQYKSTMINISLTNNNIYTINKILMAREIVCQMIEVRQYQGDIPFVYFNNLNADLGHFKMDLEGRYLLARNATRPLFEKNFFDIYGIHKASPDGKTNVPVYINFLIEEIKDLNEYLHKLEESVNLYYRDQRRERYRQLYIIVILEPTMKIKEQFDYQLPQEERLIGDVKAPLVNTIFDIMSIRNLQYNPITNVYQPRFRLIKNGAPEHKQILADYGSEDALPRMNQLDPVNIFYGGKHKDIYEIIRNQITLVGDENDSSMHKNPQLHFDVAHRMVR